MSFVEKLKSHFENISNNLFQSLATGEELGLNLVAEHQTYVRFNNSKVRQATDVQQAKLELHFQNNQRQVKYSVDLSLEGSRDAKTLGEILARARQECLSLPEDPYCNEFKNNGSSSATFNGSIPPSGVFINEILELTVGTDFTGLLATGPQVSANKNSKGQSHWFSTDSFFIDYSLFTVNLAQENKAVKGSYASSSWDKKIFAEHISRSQSQIELLKKASKSLTAGEYRAYLAPAASAELLGMLSWGAVSYSAFKKGNCALALLAENKESLSPKFSMQENFALGLTPRFNSLGEIAPEKLLIINKGKLENFLITSRTAKEFQVTANGADLSNWGGEYLRSPEILPGTLPENEALQALGTGIYIANLHYLNWSDLQSARLTGMTRYACFWVEDGKVVAPIKDMRFDDSLYRILGSELEDLTKELHIDPSVDTYWKRAMGGKKVPGLLLKSLRFIL